MSIQKQKTAQSRRKFLSDITLGSIGTIGTAGWLSGCSGSGPLAASQDAIPPLGADRAPGGRVLKAGLVGCGGRGTGAAVNFVDAGPDLEIVALGDVFPDQLEKCRRTLEAGRGIRIADENCFTGFDSYQKVIDSGVDIVLFATPPHFRPMHVDAAVKAGKHIFQEKPIAVDPVGARNMMETTQLARQKNLCMVSGTIRRYQRDYVETQRRVANGEIGEITGATIIRNGGALWWIERKPGWTDMEYMLRNWGNFSWLSGDHIVEMFIHELDAMSWHVGSHPVRATGYGGRQQRISGDQFDNFSIIYEYENGKKVHCSTRQINGCDNRRVQIIHGTEGYADASGSLYNHNGDRIWQYPHPDENDADQTWRVNSPLVQEHVELVTAIRSGNYINDSEEQIKSTRISIMGRMAAYTGREISWEEVLESDLRLGPDRYEFGPVEGIPETAPVVGTASAPTDRFPNLG
ncbi:MAG: Gfo/Idh/MocA family oxidoreductase [Balneolales bacterium]